MAYSDPASKVAGDAFDLTAYDVFRDNWLASAVRAMNAKGDLAGGTGADALARLAVGNDDSALVAASGETTGLAWQIQPACRVHRTATYDPPDNTWTAIPFPSADAAERFDTDGVHDLTSNDSRLTIPANGGGLYSIGGCVHVGGGSPAGWFGLRVTLNGTTTIVEHVYLGDSGDLDNTIHVNTLYALSATDYVELEVYTDTTVSVQGNYSPEFWAIWQRRQ